MKAVVRLVWALALPAFLLFALFAHPASAQIRVVVGGGLSVASLVGDDAEDEAGNDLDSRTGFHGGASLDIPIGGILSFSPGLRYVQKGATEEVEGIDLEIDLSYVELPLLLRVAAFSGPSVGVSLFFGPSVAFEVACELSGRGGGITISRDCEDTDLDTKSIDLGAMLGAGLSFPLTDRLDLVLNGALDLGLTSIDDTGEDADVKNSAWLIGAGVGLSLGR